MPMTPDVIASIADVIALVAFSASLVLVLRAKMTYLGQPYGRAVKVFLALAFSVYVFSAASNVLERTGITRVLSQYEDYGEVLFVPLIAYVVWVTRMALQARELRVAAALVREEHDLLSTVVETGAAGTVMVDLNGDITFANEQARDLLGLTQADKRSPWVMPDDLVAAPGDRPADLRTFASGSKAAGVQTALRTPHGTRVLSVFSSPVRDGAGGDAGSVVTFVDVTEREQARKELAEAQERYSLDLERTVNERTEELLRLNAELTDANRAKHDLLANVSHELRTPLNVMIGFTDVLASGMPGPLTKEQAKQLGMIRESGTQLLAMVNDLLDIERMEAGHAVVAHETVKVDRLLSRLVEMMTPLAAQRALEITFECAGDVEATTDPRLLTQIVRNLVSNAIKFTPAGGHVDVTVADRADEFAVTVADDGIGIPEADHAHVFEAFTQIRSGHGHKPQGTGLGLAICREMVTALGGTIAVTSAVGQGATFVVVIPKRPATRV